jgi:phosphoglucomutase
VIIATDPDADRVGVAVKENGSYRLLTGNMTGVLIAEYMLSQKKEQDRLAKNAALISTIVSTDMTRAIAKAYDAAYIDVLTGFKYIGEKIKEFEDTKEHTFVFGFEESYGCLPGTYTRDKDAVAASLLVCEIAAFYHKQGLTLVDALNKIYEKYGYYLESVESITYKGIEGQKNISKIMASLRQSPPQVFGSSVVIETRDYLNKTISHPDGSTEATTLPAADVLYFAMADNSWACVRPSGTEPKIKIYFGVVVPSDDLTMAQVNAKDKLSGIWGAMKRIVAKAVE